MNKPTHEQMIKFLKLSNDVAERAISLGHHPFGAVSVAPDHETVLFHSV